MTGGHAVAGVHSDLAKQQNPALANLVTTLSMLCEEDLMVDIGDAFAMSSSITMLRQRVIRLGSEFGDAEVLTPSS